MDGLTRKYCRALSVLLEYPSETPWEISGRLTALLREKEGENKVEQPLSSLAKELRRLSLEELRRDYVAIFDLKPEYSLGMAWHIHGDTPAQGRALAGLSVLYADAGYMLSDGALPDHLPVLLEFLSVAPEWAITAAGEGFLPQVEALGLRLSGTESVYAFVGQALAALAEVLLYKNAYNGGDDI